MAPDMRRRPQGLAGDANGEAVLDSPDGKEQPVAFDGVAAHGLDHVGPLEVEDVEAILMMGTFESRSAPVSFTGSGIGAALGRGSGGWADHGIPWPSQMCVGRRFSPSALLATRHGG